MTVPTAIHRRLEQLERSRAARHAVSIPASDDEIINAITDLSVEPRHIDALYLRLGPDLERRLIAGAVRQLMTDRAGKDSGDYTAWGPGFMAIGVICESPAVSPPDELLRWLRRCQDEPDPWTNAVTQTKRQVNAGLMLRALAPDNGKHLRGRAEEIIKAAAWPVDFQPVTDESLHRLCDPLSHPSTMQLILGRSDVSSPEERATVAELKRRGLR